MQINSCPPKPHTGPENGNLPHNGRTKQGRQKTKTALQASTTRFL